MIDRLTVTFDAGRLTVVSGRSGSGKTTLLRMIAGLERPDSGSLTIDRQSLPELDSEQLAALRRERIGYLPQEPWPVRFLSAEENVLLALRVRGWSSRDAAARARAVLEQVGLTKRSRQRVGRLSAGEAQRVVLARALASAAGLLIADEPSSRLDDAGAESVAELLAHAAHEQGQTVICATHDGRLVRRADAVLALESRPRPTVRLPAMSGPPDLSRLTELRDLDGMTPQAWEQMVQGLIDSLSDVVDRVSEALERDDLEQATQAAHLGRNDALMFSSGELAAALGALEQAARTGDADGARSELPRLRELWPQTREAIERIRANPS